MNIAPEDPLGAALFNRQATRRGFRPAFTSIPARQRFRFSLLSLVLFVLLAGSSYGLWATWEPWVLKWEFGSKELVDQPPKTIPLPVCPQRYLLPRMRRSGEGYTATAVRDIAKYTKKR